MKRVTTYSISNNKGHNGGKQYTAETENSWACGVKHINNLGVHSVCRSECF